MKMSRFYGRYDAKTFSEIFPSLEVWNQEMEKSKIEIDMTAKSKETLYFLLYAKYGGSCIASDDENQFKYKVWTIMFSQGPTWEKQLEIQKKLRHLSDDELMRGGINIANHSMNPAQAPSTSALEELGTIDSQTSTNSKRSKLDAYSALLEVLRDDVTKYFIKSFERLFISILAPQEPLLYEEEE